MTIQASLHIRRNADKMRLVGWINVALTLLMGAFVPDRITAFVIGTAWVVLVLGITQIIAWRMDVRANRIVRE